MSFYDGTFKILLVSDPEVDISGMFTGYLTEITQPEDRKTIGVEFMVKTLVIDKKKFILQLWDLGQEERFRFLLPTYCSGAKGVILLYDVTKPKTLNNIEELVNIVHQKSGDIPIMLVGVIQDEKNKQQVSAEEGVKIANSRNVNGYIELNLKTGKNVEKAFEALTRLILADKGYHAPIRRMDSGDSAMTESFLNWVEPRDGGWIFCNKCKKKLTEKEFLFHPCFITHFSKIWADSAEDMHSNRPISLRGAIMAELKQLFSKRNKDAEKNIYDLKTKKLKK